MIVRRKDVQGGQLRQSAQAAYSTLLDVAAGGSRWSEQKSASVDSPTGYGIWYGVSEFE